MHKIYLGTRKGGFVLESEDRKNWTVSDPILLGNVIYHMVPDPRDSNIVLMACKTGHLGPTVFRSLDGGKTWKEASKPPRFNVEDNKTVNFVFWLTPGHKNNKGHWFAGTCPQAVFQTFDNGDTWAPYNEFNKHPLIVEVINAESGTPIGALTHSIRIDPTNKDRIGVSLSGGGYFETRDGGKEWKAMNKRVSACFLPDEFPEWGHCVHNLIMHPANPNIIYQQNHCGIYRVDFSKSEEWERIGKNLPERIGDFGFPILIDPKDPNKVWSIPLDASDMGARTSIDGQPAIYKSTDAGKTWTRKTNGFPPDNGWFTILRQAAAYDTAEPLGLYFGTKSGQIWGSLDDGESWTKLLSNFPQIYSLEVL